MAALIGAVAAILACTLALVWPANYVSPVSFLLNGGSSMDGLLDLPGVADLLPRSLAGTMSSTGNGYTYAQVLKSRAFLEEILKGTDSTFLETPIRDSFVRQGREPARELDKGITRLSRHILTKYDSKSSVVTVTVRDRNPKVAAAICNLIARGLRRFDLEVRVTQARATVGFLQERLNDAHQNLIAAEDRLVSFGNANARIGNAPGLLVRQKRLERDVNLSEGVYTLLVKQLELARVQEKKELPVFAVIDPPVVATEPDSFSPLAAAALACFFSVTVFLLFRVGSAMRLR